MTASLIVVAKKPEPGFTKTRLCPPFTPQEAAQFYRCLMLDTLELAARVQGVEHCLAYTPIGAHAYFQNLVPEGFSLLPQQGVRFRPSRRPEKRPAQSQKKLLNGKCQVEAVSSQMHNKLKSYCFTSFFNPLTG